jgi:hypothetical protein
MTLATAGLPAALHGFGQTLDRFDRPGVQLGHWRWQVRQQLAAVRDALAAETGNGADGWTAAREVGLLRERNALLARIGVLGSHVLEHPDAAAVLLELRRLAADTSHHVQRAHDLAYDEVELELGGSE